MLELSQWGLGALCCSGFQIAFPRRRVCCARPPLIEGLV